MEQHVAELEFLRDGLLDQLNDPTLPPLDRRDIEREVELMTAELTELGMILVFQNLGLEEHALLEEDDDDASTLSLESSVTIGDDEYEEDRLIANDDFDLGGEV